MTQASVCTDQRLWKLTQDDYFSLPFFFSPYMFRSLIQATMNLILFLVLYFHFMD